MEKNIYPDFAKLDFEGAEISAIEGMNINKIPELKKLCVCVYHRLDDEEKIIKLLDDSWQYEHTDGLMIWGEWKEPYFRHGVLRIKKRIL